MVTPPTFASLQDYSARIEDVGFWWPWVAEVLKRHGLADASAEPLAGVGGTYPTILQGDVVVKLFGYVRSWREGYAAERAAQILVAQDPEIATPRLLGEGLLFDDTEATWPYLILTRMSGMDWQNADLSQEQRLSVAADLGEQVRRVHALHDSDIATDADLPAINVTMAAAQSSLPPHLVAQVDDYLARVGPFDRVFVHGDLFARHVFVKDGRLSGIIDWGDAMFTDRYYELAKLHLDTFGCDKSLLRVFLEASNWPVDKEFPRRSMAFALHRQATGLAQHLTNDTFHKLPNLLPLQDIATLDELATELFTV